jgi:hypothetical protein
MTKDQAANLRALHGNPVYKLAKRLSTPKSAGGRGLPANSAVSVALAEAGRLADENPGLAAGYRRLGGLALRAVTVRG